MTEIEYKDLLVWCRSKINFGDKLYNDRHAIKNTAIEIKRSIILHGTWIKNYSRALARSVDENKIKRYEALIIEMQDKKRLLIKQFLNLKIPE